MGKQQPIESLMQRLDPFTFSIDNPSNVSIELFANDEVPVERGAIEQIRAFARLAEPIDALSETTDFFGGERAALERIVLTPDFHKGSGMPVGTVVQTSGFVIPRAVGSDVCCGMGLLVTDLRASDLDGHFDALQNVLRALFFQGKRNIPMSPRQREAMLREGLLGVHDTYEDNAGRGLWKYYDPGEQLAQIERAHHMGSLSAGEIFSFGDYVRASGTQAGRDSQTGSLGGGNHFVEIQVLSEILDGAVAHAWGIESDRIAIMVHSGSVGLGGLVGGFFTERAREVYPAAVEAIESGFYPLPTAGPHVALTARYIDAMRNAANLAFANRLFLGLMTVRGLCEVLGRRIDARLVYDVPHNLIWSADGERAGLSSESFVHRKGACPAFGPEPERATPWRYTGHPVIVPGSMGSSSFLLAGQGHEHALESACHGAGRVLSRNDSRAVDESAYRDAMQGLRVVTPIDPSDPMVRRRRDILEQYHQRVKEEAPLAYKPVAPVIDTVEGAGIARPVARLLPLLTVKG